MALLAAGFDTTDHIFQRRPICSQAANSGACEASAGRDDKRGLHVIPALLRDFPKSGPGGRSFGTCTGLPEQ